MLAAFQVGPGDLSIDLIAECCSVSDITVVTYQVCCVTILALSAGLCLVPVPFSARSFSQQQQQYTGKQVPMQQVPFRSGPGKKVADWLNPR